MIVSDARHKARVLEFIKHLNDLFCTVTSRFLHTQTNTHTHMQHYHTGNIPATVPEDTGKPECHTKLHDAETNVVEILTQHRQPAEDKHVYMATRVRQKLCHSTDHKLWERN